MSQGIAAEGGCARSSGEGSGREEGRAGARDRSFEGGIQVEQPPEERGGAAQRSPGGGLLDGQVHDVLHELTTIPGVATRTKTTP